MLLPSQIEAKPPDDRFAFLHIDLNSFFASVEQQLHPEYRGKPTAVVGTMADTGTIIAASYECKALGVKTLTKVGEARARIPDIIFVNGSHSVYAKYSHDIAAAIERVCPVAHTPSIDEMVCQLMGREGEPPRARQIALAIKQAIRDDVGETLRCSIGMAPNRYLAKIASDMQKPDGLIGLLPSQLPRAIAHLELRDLPGVGARTEERLHKKGIRSMPDLLALDRPAMHKLWDSVWGDRLYHWLRGHATGDDGAPVPNETQKSLGHSHVLGPTHRSAEGAWAVAHKLLHKAAMRLRMEHFHAGTIAVTIKYSLTREQANSIHLSSRPEHTTQNLSSRPEYAAQNLSSPPEYAAQHPSSRPERANQNLLSRPEHGAQNLSSRPERGAQHLSSRPERGARSGETPVFAPANRKAKVKKHTSGITETAWSMEARFRPCQDTLSLLEILRGVWSQQPSGPEHTRPFFVGITMRNLIPESELPQTLFDEPGHRKELAETMDKLNLRFGHTAVHFAGMLPARDSAPTRIAFTQIPVQYGVEYM